MYLLFFSYMIHSPHTLRTHSLSFYLSLRMLRTHTQHNTTQTNNILHPYKSHPKTEIDHSRTHGKRYHIAVRQISTSAIRIHKTTSITSHNPTPKRDPPRGCFFSFAQFYHIIIHAHTKAKHIRNKERKKEIPNKTHYISAFAS